MSAPFQGERLGLGLYPGVYMGMARPILLGLKFGQILFFLGRGVENWRYILGYIKLKPQQHFFIHDNNVIFRNYCVAITSKICNPATLVHGARAKFADK